MDRITDKVSLSRTGHVLNSKMRKYLIPMIATALAMALDEFVDCIIVANMLDIRAMTVVCVATPVTLIVAAAYILFGSGGSTMYAQNLGQRNTKAAAKYFSVSLLSAGIVAVLICVIGLLLLTPICSLLCSDASMRADLASYVRILFLNAPFIIVIQTLAGFLPAAGVPNLSTLICVIANVSNLIFDYMYIKYLHLGIVGTAYATMTGYILCLIFIVIMLLLKKIRVYTTVPTMGDFYILKNIVGQGGAGAITQLSYTVKFTFYNTLAFSLGGTVALEAFNVCRQLLSIMGIGLAGIRDSAVPFMAVLNGQRDKKGMKYVLRSSMFYNALITGIMVIILGLFPQIIFFTFNVADPEIISIATVGIRIVLLMFIPRGMYILFQGYARIIGWKHYSMIISLLDGFILLIPVAQICAKICGITGIWISFPLSSLLIIIGVMIYNRILAEKSEGRMYGCFLLEREENEIAFDVTIGEDDSYISRISKEMSEFCERNGVKSNIASRVGLIAEEMTIYTRTHRKKSGKIDILTRIANDEISIDFRSEGTPFNPLAKSEEDNDINFRLLNDIPSEITYEYVLGMNSTRFIIRTEARG